MELAGLKCGDSFLDTSGSLHRVTDANDHPYMQELTGETCEMDDDLMVFPVDITITATYHEEPPEQPSDAPSEPEPEIF